MAVTLNNSDRSTDITLSGGNLTATFTDAASQAAVRATASFSSGKLYYEWKSGGTNPNNCNAGWASASESLTNMGKTTNSVNVSQQFNDVSFNNTNLGAISSSGASGDWLAWAIDIGGALVWVINITQGHGWNNGAGNPSTGTGGYSIAGLTNLPWFPEVDFFGSQGNAVTVVNFGATAFNGTIPTGFSPVDPGDTLMSQIWL